jgi:hypothetical protein
VFAADDVTRRLLDPERRIEHWSEFERGGHFAAMEAPDLLIDDARVLPGLPASRSDAALAYP